MFNYSIFHLQINQITCFLEIFTFILRSFIAQRQLISAFENASKVLLISTERPPTFYFFHFRVCQFVLEPGVLTSDSHYLLHGDLTGYFVRRVNQIYDVFGCVLVQMISERARTRRADRVVVTLQDRPRVAPIFIILIGPLHPEERHFIIIKQRPEFIYIIIFRSSNDAHKKSICIP